jgi:phosphate transport system substrate-binding protein
MDMKKLLSVALAAVLMTAVAACSPADKNKAPAPAADAAAIAGAGATFPAPLYAKWSETYRATTGNSLNYQAIGSGGGVKQIQAKTVDFGATDKPLTKDKLDEAGLYQFPTVIGGVVPIVNLPGVASGQLKLSGALLADIYLGKVTKWNDAAIAALNPGVKLPGLPITVVHRSDGSGTTFLFASYLAMKSPEWSSKVGASDSLQWPAGVGGAKNDGVAALVRQTVGSIGYVEYAYAMKTANVASVLVQSKDGGWPKPDAASFAAATEGADWKNAPGNYLLILDQPGANAWPITGATFILVYKEQANAEKASAVLKFFDYGFASGDATAAELYYVPLPASVKTMVRQQWAETIKSGGKPVYTAPAS